jgi:DNA modification methylase
MEQIIHGDCLEVLKGLPDESVHCCVTSPPYFGLRDYGVDGQLGLEKGIRRENGRGIPVRISERGDQRNPQRND